RRGRSVPQSSREGDRAVHGREVVRTGIGPDPAVAAHEAGRAQTMTHRNGTATLFAALDVLTGKAIGQCLPRHRHTEFLKFLRHRPRRSRRTGLPRRTPPIPTALHPDLLVVAQPGRTLVP